MFASDSLAGSVDFMAMFPRVDRFTLSWLWLRKNIRMMQLIKLAAVHSLHPSPMQDMVSIAAVIKLKTGLWFMKLFEI